MTSVAIAYYIQGAYKGHTRGIQGVNALIRLCLGDLPGARRLIIGLFVRRLALKSGSWEKLGGGDNGPVEVDETFIGPKPQKMHRARRLKMQGAENGNQKSIVMGMLDRDSRQIRAKVIPNVKRETLQTAILDEIEKGSTVYTDGFSGYDRLAAKEYAMLQSLFLGNSVRMPSVIWSVNSNTYPCLADSDCRPIFIRH